MKISHFIIILFVLTITISLNTAAKRVITGDERTEKYFKLLKGKRIALYSNHTGLANGKHIVDILTENHLDVTTILSPEHGFRGNADAGEHVGNSTDEKTGIPIVSMYNFGNNGVDSATATRFDILVVDIQGKNYKHSTLYEITTPPSPNLPNAKSIYLYPSTCFFEGTVVSLGRGTSLPFQIYGHPNMKGYDFSFTPQSVSGAKNPPLLGKKCFGVDLSKISDKQICERGIDLNYVIDAYQNLNIGEKFFTPFFDKLAGCSYIREMIEQGCDAEEIKARWKNDVEKFMKQRAPYLIYK